jgi:hypothetical protein
MPSKKRGLKSLGKWRKAIVDLMIQWAEEQDGLIFVDDHESYLSQEERAINYILPFLGVDDGRNPIWKHGSIERTLEIGSDSHVIRRPYFIYQGNERVLRQMNTGKTYWTYDGMPLDALFSLARTADHYYDPTGKLTQVRQFENQVCCNY